MDASLSRDVWSTMVAEPPPTGYRSIWSMLQGVPLSQGYLDVDGINTRYLRAGNPSAPKVIMLPGTGGNAETYCANLGPLSAEFDCWAIDPVGFGHSDKPDYVYDTFAVAKHVIRFCELVGAETVDLLGCSVGSWSAFRIATIKPQLVRSMVMTSPLGGPVAIAGEPFADFWAVATDSEESARMAEGALVRKQAAANPTWRKAEEIIHSLIAHPDNRLDDMVASRLIVNQQPRAAETVDSVLWWTDAGHRLRNGLTRSELAKIHHPVLGFIDQTQSLCEMAKELFSALPNGRLLVSQGCGHWNHFEDARQYNAIVSRFLTAGPGSLDTFGWTGEA